MAERRMFAKTIVLSDAFLDMPITSQALYFHICMTARDKGITNSVYSTAGMIGAEPEDVEILLEKGFIKPIVDDEDFTSYEIVHWYENNGIGETAKKRNNYRYRKWREEVLKRDGCCVKCGSTENLEAHHIKSFAGHPLDRFDLGNGTTLCHDCHKQLHKEVRDRGRSEVDQNCD